MEAVIGAPESVVGIAATAAAGDRGDRLRRVDHAPAAEGDKPLGADLVDDRRGSSGTFPAGTR